MLHRFVGLRALGRKQVGLLRQGSVGISPIQQLFAGKIPSVLRCQSTVSYSQTETEEESVDADRPFASQLERDALRFFVEKKQGHLWPYLYGEPQDKLDKVDGGRLYLQALRTVPEYYLYSGEAQLFQSQSAKIAKVIGDNATVIELGPGSKESVSKKTVPFLSALPALQGYVGIDISLAFIQKTLETVRSALPGIEVSGYQQDFSQLSPLEGSENIVNPVIFFKGSTIANLTQDELAGFVAQIPKLVGGRPHFFSVVHDSNQNAGGLLEAYDNPPFAQFFENLMYRLQRDADSIQFDPSKFEYAPAFDGKSHDFAHIVKATTDQVVDIDDHQPVSIKQGDKFKLLSSFKYPVPVFQDMISRTRAYDPIDVFTDSSGRMVCHIFRSK